MDREGEEVGVEELEMVLAASGTVVFVNSPDTLGRDVPITIHKLLFSFQKHRIESLLLYDQCYIIHKTVKGLCIKKANTTCVCMEYISNTCNCGNNLLDINAPTRMIFGRWRWSIFLFSLYVEIVTSLILVFVNLLLQ